MSVYYPQNAIERRFMQARKDWLSFAKNPPARLMYWQANEADIDLIETFIQVQQELSNSVLRLTAEYHSANQYSSALINMLLNFYEERREGSIANGIQADWQVPVREEDISDLAYFFQLTDSLIDHHPDIFPGFIFIFKPWQNSIPASAANWFSELLNTLDDAEISHNRIRFLLYGHEENPFKQLMEPENKRIQVVFGNYKMATVPREMVTESTEKGDSGRFRRLFIALTETLTNNDPQRLEKLRETALAISQQQQWFDQTVVVQLIAGAAYLKWQDYAKALAAYQAAMQAGEQAILAEHPAGYKLVANSLFGEASVYLNQQDYQQAAQCYERIPAYTTLAEDWILTIEAWRMSGYCWQQLDKEQQQINAGFQALQAGERLEPNMRQASSLPFAAYALLQLFEPDCEDSQQYQEVTQQLHLLFGEEWQAIITAANQGLTPPDHKEV